MPFPTVLVVSSPGWCHRLRAPSSRALGHGVRNLSAFTLSPRGLSRAWPRSLPSSLLGPYDACQSTLHAATWCNLAIALRPAEVASLGSSRGADLPAMSHAGSSMGTLPSEVSPRRRRQTLSGRAFLLAVHRLAAPRLRGFQLSSRRVTLRPHFVHRAGAFSDDGVVHTTEGSLLSWSFPPSRMTSRPRSALLRNSSHGLLSCAPALHPTLRRGAADSHVRSSESQRTGSLRPYYRTSPPWGFCLSAPPFSRKDGSSTPRGQIGRAHV